MFHGIDSTSGRQIFAGLFDGYPFHPRYQRQFNRYLRNPTRVAPPLPRDFPAALYFLLERATDSDELIFQFPPGSLVGSPGALDVRLGANSVVRDMSGAIRF